MQKIKSSLQIKVLFIILGVFISIGALDLAIKHYIIYSGFSELELHETQGNQETCISFFDRSC